MTEEGRDARIDLNEGMPKSTGSSADGVSIGGDGCAAAATAVVVASAAVAAAEDAVAAAGDLPARASFGGAARWRRA
ncbi:hypothetical protein E2562_036466 [Oryza meyeriana var. granulata]|uniref:Uncharacterized protein n=1 Tax=Oryza meyeriana var. granulata TaxID=110450 RepID=A0A6G1ET74_9ORYZ|nr:hypothetical protein E2562_036466 [Oryza meyeriana var. granulata]